MPNVTDEIRSELRQRVEARGTKYWAEFNETQAVELASGYVSGEVRAMFLSMLAWMDEDRIAEARQQADEALARRQKRRSA